MICTRNQRSNLREVENLFDGEPGAEGVADEEDSFVPPRRDQLAPKAFGVAREDGSVKQQTLPEALEWLWQDYKPVTK